MYPNGSIVSTRISDTTKVQNENNSLIKNDRKLIIKSSAKSWIIDNLFQFKTKLIWPNIIGIFFLHFYFLYAVLTFPYFRHKKTVLWGMLVGQISGFGITGGAHRYFTHRTFKAKLPLKILLQLAFYTSGQNSLYNWVRDHRVHHKFTETDADPHNSERGFFFSHVGWLMMKKHPEVLKQGQKIDMSDITGDPVIMTLEKFFPVLKCLLSFIIPFSVPVLFWNESWYFAVTSQIIRYTLSLNFTWSVNSFAHIWGSKPYDKTIKPVENKWVAIVTGGEGWHNYHHVFPCDYKAAELGNYKYNLTSTLINAFAKIGWAYDLKQPSKETIENVINRQEKEGYLKNCTT